jgi:two-component system response regulator
MDKISILLVEDNADHEFLALKIIENALVSDKIMVVRDGQEALDYLFYEGIFSKRPVGNPQMILLDLKLPKVSGLDVLKRIRSISETKDIPVIILTTSNNKDDIKACYGEGANCYITKPITMDKFIQAIHQFLSYWANQNSAVE